MSDDPAALLRRLREPAEAAHEVTRAWGSPPAFFGGPAGEDELLELGVASFPPDYAAFARECRRFVAMDIGSGYALHSPLQFFGEPGRVHVDVGSGLVECAVVAIGSDGGGNLFLMCVASFPGDARAVVGHVFRHDHERPPRPDGVAIEGLTLVATSFSHFLERVAEDWEHFARDDRTWTYLT